LLDWLAADFMEHDWSLKHLHKQILMSATWRQSASHNQAAHYAQIDPQGSLLWRACVRRLTAEQLRDALLTVSGELEERFGGPSREPDAPCRSLYVKRFRNSPHEFFYAFDSANGLKSVAERVNTTTPTQSLLMLNGEWVWERAQRFAERVGDAAQAPRDAIDYATLLCWGRRPSEAEMNSLERFLAANPLVDLCHVLLNSNEFLYVD